MAEATDGGTEAPVAARIAAAGNHLPVRADRQRRHSFFDTCGGGLLSLGDLLFNSATARGRKLSKVCHRCLGARAERHLAVCAKQCGDDFHAVIMRLLRCCAGPCALAPVATARRRRPWQLDSL